MGIDAHKNFAYTTVSTAPSPATSGTSLVVADGTVFPAVPFNATVWPVGVQPTAANAEIVRVTAISTNTLTITRAQEGSSARTVVIGDQIAATITAKTLTDAEIGVSQFSIFADAGNTNDANEDDLVNQTIAAGLLAANGDRLEAVASGIFANNNHTKRLRVRYTTGNAGIIGDTGTMTFAGAATDTWRITVEIVRVSSSSVRCMVHITVNGGTPTVAQPIYTLITALTLANSTSFRITGQVPSGTTAANDIVVKMASLKFFPA